MHDSSSRWLWLQSGILVVCMAQILVSADGNVSIDSKNGILPEGTVRNQVGDAELEVLCRTTEKRRLDLSQRLGRHSCGKWYSICETLPSNSTAEKHV